MRLILLFFALLFSSCENNMTKDIWITFPQKHFWETEYDKDMWYTLEYYDGREIVRQTIPQGKRRVKVSVYYDSTIIALAHPLNELAPLGGALKDGEDEIYLSFEEGKFVTVLMKSIPYNENQIRYINYDKAKEKLVGNYDLDQVYYALLEGEFLSKDFKSYDKTEIELVSLPSGKYIPEDDTCPMFFIYDGENKTLSLDMGVHRFAKVDGNIYYKISITSEDTVIQSLSLPRW